jgi:signal transduction histidine kinase
VHADLAPRDRTAIPWILVACLSPLFLVVLVVSAVNGSFRDSFVFIALAMIVGYTSVGALLASRRMAPPIGWVMMTMGIAFLFTGLVSEWVTYTYATRPGSLSFGRAFVAWVSAWSFLFTFGPAPILLAIFPTGHVPTPRWRWLPPATIATLAITWVAEMFLPGPVDTDVAMVDNPIGIESLGGLLDVVDMVGLLTLVGLVVAAALALALRYRRSVGDERRQIRLFAYTSWLAFALFLLALLASGPFHAQALSEIFFYLFFGLIGLGLPIAIAIAILRYRLYDMDLVIRKTVVFVVVVTGVFAVGFGLIVVVATPVLERLWEDPSLFVFAGIALGLVLPPLFRLSRRIADRIVYGGRANPYEVLASFADRMGETYATDDVLERMAGVLGQAVGASVARVWLHSGSEMRPEATVPTDAPAAVPVAAAGDVMPEIPGEWATEVRDRGELLGAVSVVMPANDPMNPAKERLVRDLAGQAGLVLRNVRLIDDLRTSRRRIVTAQDERARRLERDIHDGAQQQLVALAVQLRLARTMVERDPARAIELLTGLEGSAGDALENLRDLARGIYPPLLADKGLVAAIEAQARKAAIAVRVDARDVARYAADVEATVYFCTLEALNNAAKYAEAGEVTVGLAGRDGHLVFTIADDGRGFDPAAVAVGSGLHGMRDRVEAVGGRLRVQSGPGEGTVVTGEVPVGRPR